MSQTNSLPKKGGQPRFLLFLCAAIAFFAMPAIIQLGTTTAHADGGVVPALTAQLTGEPIGGATPHGFSYYTVITAATPDPVKLLFVSVSNVNLPDGTVLQVSLNSAAIGTITLDNDAANSMEGGHGSLRLSSLNGDTVPGERQEFTLIEVSKTAHRAPLDTELIAGQGRVPDLH